MDDFYQHLHDQAYQMRSDVHGSLDSTNSQSARLLQEQVKHFEEDVQMQRNPQQLEDRVRHIQQQLMEIKSRGHLPGEEPVMGVSDADSYWHKYEDIRQHIRQHPHF